MWNYISESLERVLKEFGVVGVITYVGGLILLVGFTNEEDLQKQILLGVVGVMLLVLSTYIAYFRLKVQMEREKALIKMAESTCNKLAEQLGGTLSNEQVSGITQKIRQTQRDLINAIVKNTSIEKDTQD